MTWLINNIVEILGIIVGGFIAYHVFFLSRRINLKDRLVHKDNVRKRIEPLLESIARGINREVELVNVKKYLTDYPTSNRENRHGYTYLRAELKGLRFDGVEFFCAVREIYRKEDDTLTLQAGANRIREEYNVLEAGTIPYDWIEYVDGRGDEYGWRPQFFTRFSGKKKSPYKSYSYYKTSDTYREGREPIDFQWTEVAVES